MATVNLDVPPHEVTAVYTHPDAKVDIVLVHGLNGDPKKTWVSKENNVFWPAELLPNTLGLPPANILVYGYNSKTHGSATDNPILNHAQTLVAHLTYHRQRQGTLRNPILWIAHSLGGILTKRALLYSKDIKNADREPLRSIFVSTFAIVFLGTPHTGSNLASVGLSFQTLGSRLLPKAIFESEPILLRTLLRDSEILKEINNQFLEIYQLFKIHMAHENLKTDLKVTKALIVSSESASPQLANVTYYGIEATHSGMCKFSSETAPGYRIMTTALREWIRDAPGVIQTRWSVEIAERTQHLRYEMEAARAKAASLDMGQLSGSLESPRAISPTASPLSDAKTATPEHATVSSGAEAPTRSAVLDSGDIVSSPTATAPEGAASSLHPPLPSRASDTSTVRPEPFFIVPEKFRPNSYFVGRDAELAELHALLNDPKRSSEGTSAVVIHSLHGGGKTHLAREYFFKHRHDYPGGVCWVRAKSIHEMEQFYWEIAMKGPLQEFPADKIHEALNVGSGPQADPDDPRKIVDIVCKWFRSRDHWLLVFDAILFNTAGIERFIPDARNTSIIYTSTQSGVSGNHLFDNPRILKLGMLHPEHARELLFKELERTNPSKEDERLALDLVKDLGCLPLMVHISARHLRATQEPLAKYLRTHRDRSRIKPGELSAYVAVYDELKARNASPALNLMYILAYFDTRIPIGLLNLGLQVLEKSTVATHDAASKTRSLTNTLKTLIAFALLERTEANSVSPTSSRSSNRRGIKRASKSVDVLLIHTVVQLFFAGVLHDEKVSDIWMERAAAVYCHAFDEAQDLIASTPQVGILDDYRCFKIHGHKLAEHLTARMDKKGASHSVLAEPLLRIQQRLGQCDEAISRISKDTQKQIVDGLQSPGPVELNYTIVSVFERTNSISDSEDSGHASVATPTDSVGTPALSPDFPRIASRATTFSDGERVGVNVRDDEFLYDDFYIPRDEQPYSTAEAPAPAPPAQPVQLKGKGKQPMTRPSIDSYSDMDESTIFYQSPELADSATVPGLQRPHPRDYRLSGGLATYTPHVPHMPDDYDDIETVTAHAPTPQPPNLSPAETDIYQLQAPDSTPHLRDHFSRPAEHDHRTVRKYNGRRYHDSAGAWRQMGAGDPRVTVDYGSAEGSVIRPHSRISGNMAPSAMRRTEAESSLRALSMLSLRSTQNAAANSSAIEDSLAQDSLQDQSKHRAQSTGTMDVRPLWHTTRENEDGSTLNSTYQASPPLPIKKKKTRSDSSTSFWSSSLKQFRKLLPSYRAETASSQPHQPHRDRAAPRIRASSSSCVDADRGLSDSIQDLIDARPGVFIRASGTARSSPSQDCGPFPRPPYPISDTMPDFGSRLFPGPAEVYGYAYDRAHSDLPSSIPDWAGEAHSPGARQWMSDDQMADSFPPPRPSSYSRPFMLQAPAQAGSQFPLPQQQFLRPAPSADGYTSQPMSRGPSSQSQPEAGRAVPPRRLSYVPAVAGDLQIRTGSDRRSSRNASSQSSGSRPAPISVPPGLRRNSHSSLVETEPSPTTHNPFDVHTSYQWYEEKRQRGQLVHKFVREEVHQARLQAIAQGAALRTSAGGSGSGGSTSNMRRPAQPSSAAMSRSKSDSGPVVPGHRRGGSDGTPASGAWAGRHVRAASHQYPMHLSSEGGTEYTSEPMSRGGSGSSRSRPGVSQYLPRSVDVDGAGYTSEPMSRNTSGSGHGGSQARPANAPRSGRVLQDFGSGQPGEQ